MTDSTTEPTVILETRLSHQLHRKGTTVLAEAAGRPSVPATALAELRDFMVANLHHHHTTEDDVLWPMLRAAAPEIDQGLAALSDQHDRLEDALNALKDTAIADGTDRTTLQEAAIVVRDLIHAHLEQEEPLIFPVLRTHVSPEVWADFSKTVQETAPTVAIHLAIGLYDRVATPEELARMLPPIPEEVLSGMRQQAQATFEALGETG